MKLICMTAAATILMAGAAIADDAKGPVVLSDGEMDRITAGVGRDNVAVAPWPALTDAGFALTHLSAADQGVIDKAGHLGVAVPRRP